MFKHIYLLIPLLFLHFCSIPSIAENSDDSLFTSSLHYTTKGMKYWYSKENGGIETITKIPYDDLSCKECHVKSCETCHKKKTNGSFEYSIEHAKKQELCLKCHGREASIIKIDRSDNKIDVHFESGMQCMDCHTSKEIHGDGTEYKSMKEPGFFKVSCENCHDDIEQSKSHTVHKGKLDCKACHNRHVVSCTNCHMDTLIKERKKVAIPVSGWIFLMNYDGKVTSANMQTYVVDDDKTFIMFAPQHSHSVMEQGKKCEECHATKTTDQLKQKKIKLTWLKEGKTENLKGVIPIIDGTKYDCVFQNYYDGEWYLIENYKKPIIHFAGFGSPLSKKQMLNINSPQKSLK